MLATKNSWFINNSGAAPVYDKPDFNSACLTELVFGESAVINTKQGEWFYIQCEDGYNGWVHSFFGSKSSKKNKYDHIMIYPNKEGIFSPTLPFGSRIKEPEEGSLPVNNSLGQESIIKILNNLLGIPYKWGGKTTLGFDCSGLVQAVLWVCGLNIPRDSYQQKLFFQNSKIKLNDSEPGDLHFFGKKEKVTHVGFSTGDLGIIHSQGMVRNDSLDKYSKNCNKNLLDIYLSTYSIKCKFTR